MREPRALFSLVPVGSTHPRLLAVGGQNETSVRGTSEWYDQEENEWSEGPTLKTGRKSFGALMVQDKFACTEIDPPPHSCPALDISQSCLFLTTAGFFCTNEVYKLCSKISPFDSMVQRIGDKFNLPQAIGMAAFKNLIIELS